MRFIIYGVGAIGGALAVDLNRNGYEVVGIARGAQLEALRRDGLRLRTPEGDLHARFDTVPHPGDVEWYAAGLGCQRLRQGEPRAN